MHLQATVQFSSDDHTSCDIKTVSVRQRSKVLTEQSRAKEIVAWSAEQNKQIHWMLQANDFFILFHFLYGFTFSRLRYDVSWDF